PVKAHGVLKEQGFAVRITEVLALRVPDEPGGLAGVLEAIEGQKLNVEYMYAFVEKAENDALVIVRIENVEQAIPALQELGVGLIDEDDLYNL
ncbi:MAG: amino acid-binding protein, partial [Limnochordia bacterium]